MTIEPTPHRYRVDAYEPRSDPRRMATIRDVLTENILTVTTEDEARHLIAQLTAWLDAPRLAARETAEVVARDDENGFRLLRTAHEWGVLWQDNEDDHDDGEVYWYATEATAREAFRDATDTVSCESCARFIDHKDADVDEDGIYTCADESACSAACAAKESAK